MAPSPRSTLTASAGNGFGLLVMWSPRYHHAVRSARRSGGAPEHPEKYRRRPGDVPRAAGPGVRVALTVVGELPLGDPGGARAFRHAAEAVRAVCHYLEAESVAFVHAELDVERARERGKRSDPQIRVRGKLNLEPVRPVRVRNAAGCGDGRIARVQGPEVRGARAGGRIEVVRAFTTIAVLAVHVEGTGAAGQDLARTRDARGGRHLGGERAPAGARRAF